MNFIDIWKSVVYERIINSHKEDMRSGREFKVLNLFLNIEESR